LQPCESAFTRLLAPVAAGQRQSAVKFFAFGLRSLHAPVPEMVTL